METGFKLRKHERATDGSDMPQHATCRIEMSKPPVQRCSEQPLAAQVCRGLMQTIDMHPRAVCDQPQGLATQIDHTTFNIASPVKCKGGRSMHLI